MGKFPELTFEQFVAKLFEKYPFFATIYKQSVPSLISQWRAYKNKVVVCGGALLNEDMTKVREQQFFSIKRRKADYFLTDPPRGRLPKFLVNSRWKD